MVGKAYVFIIHRIQLFSFKKLLYRSDGLDLRGFNV